MKYMLLFAGTEEYHETFLTMSDEKRKQAMAKIGEWWEAQARAGRILEGHQLQAASTATTVRRQNGKSLVSDGPFLEAKETIGGYAIIEVAGLDEAIELAKEWPAGGTVEVRPLVESPGM
jgi:hypothetical protein